MEVRKYDLGVYRGIIERMEFHDPVISVAVEPKTKADQEKMGIALQKLVQKDPSFRVNTDEESGIHVFLNSISLNYSYKF